MENKGYFGISGSSLFEIAKTRTKGVS